MRVVISQWALTYLLLLLFEFGLYGSKVISLSILGCFSVTLEAVPFSASYGLPSCTSLFCKLGLFLSATGFGVSATFCFIF